jgi:uncharacterized membrane protein YsdA (DUF1294 family)
LRAIIIYLIGINILTFLVFGIDKWKARRGKWRIPEATLIGMSIAGGGIGALLGMSLFRHKTQKRKFTLGIPAILLVQVFLAYFFFLR